jgi:hypothetical protein
MFRSQLKLFTGFKLRPLSVDSFNPNTLSDIGLLTPTPPQVMYSPHPPVKSTPNTILDTSHSNAWGDWGADPEIIRHVHALEVTLPPPPPVPSKKN